MTKDSLEYRGAAGSNKIFGKTQRSYDMAGKSHLQGFTMHNIKEMALKPTIK